LQGYAQKLAKRTSENFFTESEAVSPMGLQVLDFIERPVCLLNGQFKENGVITGCLRCQGRLINKVIPNLCG
jgi:hypothetical protein